MKIVWFNVKRNLHGIFSSVLFVIPIIAILLYAFIYKMSQETSDNLDKVFADCRVGIVDHDDSDITKEIISHLEEKYTITLLSEEQACQNLIKNKVNYVVIFPEGMSKNIHDSDEDIKVKTMNLTGSAMFTFFEEDLNYSINKYTVAGRVTDTDTDFASYRSLVENPSVKLKLITPSKNTEDVSSGQATFWGFIIFFMIYYNCYIGNKFLEDKRNHIVTRVSNTRYNYRQYISSLIYGSLVINLIQICIIAVVLNWVVNLNSIQITLGISLVLFLSGLIGLALGIFISTVSKSKSMFLALVNILINVLAMLGGLYWPITYMPKYMVLIGKFTPTYWLREVMTRVLDRMAIFGNYSLYIVLMFAGVIFFGTLLYHKYSFYKE